MVAIKLKKVHLVHGVSTTKCGRQFKEVKYTIDVNLCTCEKCLKHKNSRNKTNN